jgi:hypothetical protein
LLKAVKTQATEEKIKQKQGEPTLQKITSIFLVGCPATQYQRGGDQPKRGADCLKVKT